MTLQLRYAAVSDVGLVRKENEDSAYAGPGLLVVADGMGGHAAGEVASAAAVTGVLADDGAPAKETGPADVLRAHVARAGEQLRRLVLARPELEGMGTTLTLLLHDGDRIGVAQVGDSRAYLLREGVLELVTHDQTFVQTLVDQGRISDEEARHHPQRSLLLQALDGRVEVEPVIVTRTPRRGDRYLLCSDGLSGVVSEPTIRDVLGVGTPQEATERLVDLALRAGAPDNVTVIVADVVDDDEPDQAPMMVGAVVDSSLARRVGTAAGAGLLSDAAAEQAVDEAAVPTEVAGDEGDGQGASGPRGSGGHARRGHRVRLLMPVLLLLLLAAAGTFAGYRWTQTQYYVGVDAGRVAIYRGVPQAVAGRQLSHVVEKTDVEASSLPSYAAAQAGDTIAVRDLDEAHRVVQVLRIQAATCAVAPPPEGCPGSTVTTPSPSSTSSGSPSPSPSPSGSASTTPTPSASVSPVPIGGATAVNP